MINYASKYDNIEFRYYYKDYMFKIAEFFDNKKLSNQILLIFQQEMEKKLYNLFFFSNNYLVTTNSLKND